MSLNNYALGLSIEHFGHSAATEGRTTSEVMARDFVVMTMVAIGRDPPKWRSRNDDERKAVAAKVVVGQNAALPSLSELL